ncbi:MAG: ABC transporter ATP-binding protein [Candidatus Berkelbacteria bacterium]|nr:ABC transporter ATP-binding protein [Candidatus Berkelbacteria bacterium]
MPEGQHHEAVIEVEGLTKTFKVGDNEIRALKGIDLSVHATEFLVVFGPSGCGKTTLMNIIAGIDTPTKGTVKVRGTNIFALKDEARGIFRSEKMGIIHQMSYWAKSLSVLENVALPLIIEGQSEKSSLEQAQKVLDTLDISELAKQRPTQLSGGQQQKVGFARAMISSPWIIFADEPTGNLDSKSAEEIMLLFKELNEQHKRTIILITHNKEYWELGNRRIEMKDGQISKDSKHG